MNPSRAVRDRGGARLARTDRRVDAVTSQSVTDLAEITLYNVPAPGVRENAGLRSTHRRLGWLLVHFEQHLAYVAVGHLPRTDTGCKRHNLYTASKRDGVMA